jgi:hypothetical protein
VLVAIKYLIQFNSNPTTTARVEFIFNVSRMCLIIKIIFSNLVFYRNFPSISYFNLTLNFCRLFLYSLFNCLENNKLKILNVCMFFAHVKSSLF